MFLDVYTFIPDFYIRYREGPLTVLWNPSFCSGTSLENKIGFYDICTWHMSESKAAIVNQVFSTVWISENVNAKKLSTYFYVLTFNVQAGCKLKIGTLLGERFKLCEEFIGRIRPFCNWVHETALFTTSLPTQLCHGYTFIVYISEESYFHAKPL